MARHRSSNFVPRPILAAAGAVAATLLGDQMLYAVMPASPERWALSVALVGVLLSANRLVRLASNPLAAVILHRFGGRAPFAAAMAGAVLITAVYGWVSTFWVLLMARIAWGVCWSVLRLGGQWTVLDEATDNDRGRLIGWYGSITRLGALGGALAGGLLVEAIGHRATLTLFAAITALAGVGWHVATRGRPVAVPRLSAGASLAGFREVLRDRHLLTVSISGLVVTLVFSGLLGAALGFYFRASHGEELAFGRIVVGVVAFSGLMQSARSLSEVSTGPIVGYISDRVGRVRGVVSAMTVAAMSIGLLAATSHLGLAIVASLVCFVACAAALVQLQAAAGDLAPPQRRAAVLSTYATFLDLGAAIGPLLGLWWGTLDAVRTMFAASVVTLAIVAMLFSRAMGERVTER